MGAARFLYERQSSGSGPLQNAARAGGKHQVIQDVRRVPPVSPASASYAFFRKRLITEISSANPESTSGSVLPVEEELFCAAGAAA